MNYFLRLFSILLLASAPWIGRGEGDSEVIAALPLEAPSSWAGDTLFELVPSSRTGVQVRYQFDENHPLKRLYPYGWATGNVAIGDVNGDNRADLFFPGTTGSHRLFLQREGFRFEDVTETAKLGGTDVWGSAAIMADIDNDRDLDIYVVNYGKPNQLFVNYSTEDRVRFLDLAKQSHVAVADGGLTASFADVDNDGSLDLYLQTYHEEPEEGRPSQMEIRMEEGSLRVPEAYENSYLPFEDKDGKRSFVEAPQSDRFFHNGGKGIFEQVDTIGLQPGGTYGSGHLWWDMDHDQQPDLYLGNDSHGSDLLYRKVPGKFVEATAATLPVTPWNTRGSAAADFNNDLLMDCFISGSAPLTYRERLAYGEPNSADHLRTMSAKGARQMPWNVLYANTGTALFAEIAGPAGVRHTGSSWAAKAGDYDCDGRTDLFITNGQARDWTALPGKSLVGEALKKKTRWDILQEEARKLERDISYRNLGDWNFEDSSAAWGLDFEGMSYAAGQGDLDNDGDLDLVVCTLDGEVRLYRNHSSDNRVVIQLFGVETNRFGVGVEMIADIGGQRTLQQLYPTGGFKDSDEPIFQIGLGKSRKIDKLTLRWPKSGAIETFENLKAGYRYTVKEAISRVEPVFRKRRTTPMFVSQMALRDAGRKEIFFDEYQSQALLPPGLSHEGPAIALADLDEDGLDEILLGGSAGYPSTLIARNASVAKIKQPFTDRAEAEDGPAVYFDADGDGDNDLFIASSGIEFGEDRSALRDRLYLLDDETRYTDASESNLPAATQASSAVAAADFDQDGDIDLFVGARLDPGNYPSPGTNRILLNDGTGNFTDATTNVAPGLKKSGMITGAIWSDANNDGWLDLLLSCDMGPPQLWENTEGTLSNGTVKWGLKPFSGRWNGISGGDIDNDGDIDYLIANEGLGSYGGPKRELFSGDFGGDGQNLLLDTVREGDLHVPLVSWVELLGADPALEKFGPNSGEFAASGIAKLLADKKVQQSRRINSTVLRTGIFVNRGAERGFDFQALPNIAQVSAGFGSIIADVNFDGFSDIYLVQNRGNPSLRDPDPANRGISQLFLGKKGTEFETVSADSSGLVVFGNGRAVVTTDLNDDEKPDLLVSMNGPDPAVFLNRLESGETKPFRVDLGNSQKHPAGARVTVKIPNFPDQTAEYYAGGGYFNQSSPSLFFGAPKAAKQASAEIRWSDGTLNTKRVYFE